MNYNATIPTIPTIPGLNDYNNDYNYDDDDDFDYDSTNNTNDDDFDYDSTNNVNAVVISKAVQLDVMESIVEPMIYDLKLLGEYLPQLPQLPRWFRVKMNDTDNNNNNDYGNDGNGKSSGQGAVEDIEQDDDEENDYDESESNAVNVLHLSTCRVTEGWFTNNGSSSSSVAEGHKSVSVVAHCVWSTKMALALSSFHQSYVHLYQHGSSSLF